MKGAISPNSPNSPNSVYRHSSPSTQGSLNRSSLEKKTVSPVSDRRYPHQSIRYSGYDGVKRTFRFVSEEEYPQKFYSQYGSLDKGSWSDRARTNWNDTPIQETTSFVSSHSHAFTSLSAFVRHYLTDNVYGPDSSFAKRIGMRISDQSSLAEMFNELGSKLYRYQSVGGVLTDTERTVIRTFYKVLKGCRKAARLSAQEQTKLGLAGVVNEFNAFTNVFRREVRSFDNEGGHVTFNHAYRAKASTHWTSYLDDVLVYDSILVRQNESRSLLHSQLSHSSRGFVGRDLYREGFATPYKDESPTRFLSPENRTQEHSSRMYYK